MIERVDTSSYNGNAALNDAARRGDLATVQRLIVDESDFNRWKATDHAWNSRQWEVVDALLDAGVGEQGRNALLERTVNGGALEWTERLLRGNTSEKARGFALNHLAEWTRDAGDRPTELASQHHACLRALLVAGVAADDRRSAREKARANGDDLMVAWLAD